jgi:hypothetical protein
MLNFLLITMPNISNRGCGGAFIPSVPVAWRMKQKDDEFQVSLSSIARSHLKETNKYVNCHWTSRDIS